MRLSQRKDPRPTAPTNIGIHRRWSAGLLAIVATVAVAVAVVPAGPASAAGGGSASDVVFIGDSVTAGFGYCGASEDAPDVTCGANQMFANAWKLGNNSLDDCDPPNGVPDDRCSNNNVDGAPWSAGPWTGSPGSPTIAYAYQIAAGQNPSSAASIENWAITGSTPADWDPNGGAFGNQLQQIKNQTVVMTLGANPLLDSFLDIRVAGYPASSGACSDSTEYFSVWGGWWANPTSTVVACAEQQWTQDDQSQHLSSIYSTLLANGNRVMVLGYYANCPWSFGNWQPNGNVVDGPASGNSCASQTQEIDTTGKPTVSQLDHALGVVNSIDSMIASTVASVQQSSPNGANLQFVLPDMAAWQEHQASDSVSWVFKNDTWIHPSQLGHAQLAQTVESGMCTDFAEWCGSQPTWVSAQASSAAAAASHKRHQRIKGKVRHRMHTRRSFHLPSFTRQDQAVAWKATKASNCHVYVDRLVTERKPGTCRLVARAIKSHSLRTLTKRYTVHVRR